MTAPPLPMAPPRPALPMAPPPLPQPPQMAGINQALQNLPMAPQGPAAPPSAPDPSASAPDFGPDGPFPDHGPIGATNQFDPQPGEPSAFGRDGVRNGAALDGGGAADPNPQLYGQGLTPDAMVQRQRAIAAVYGDNCPLARDERGVASDDEWVSWARDLFLIRAASVTDRLYAVQRNRLFREGVQWISSTGSGPWRQPPKPKDTVRAVVNMIGPALDWRLQVLTEQRPGVRAKPKTADPDDQRKAQASNLFLDYQFDEQSMSRVLREAAYWAQTDGCAFLHTYWEPDAGPWQEQLDGGSMRLGDPRTCVHRIEQVRVSPEATANRAPRWVVIRELMPLGAAVAEHGADVVDEGSGAGADMGMVGDRTRARQWTTQSPTLPTRQDDMLRGVNTVERFTVYADRGEYLEKGLALVVVGRKVVYRGELPIGRIPVARITDGSSDPSYYPKAVMEDWVEAQMRLNAVYSKLVENLRRNAGGKLLAKQQSIVTDTLTGGQDTVIEVRAPGSLGDVVQPLQGFSIGPDALQTIASEIKRLEDLTGYNEVARGGMDASASGRAILAVREQLERVFAPGIYAASDSVKEWGKTTLGWGKWGYELPRAIGAVGKARPDLGRALSADDLDGAGDIELDPETMMPMPRSLKLFILDDWYAKGIIDAEQYRERYGFAFTDDISTPDTVQTSRAQRVVDAIRNGLPIPPMKWQDDENVHQTILERELILAPDVPDDQVQMAEQRWIELANQHGMKMGIQGGGPPMGGPPMGGPPGPAPLANGSPHGHGKMPPGTQPTQALPSPLAAQPLMAQQTAQSQAAKFFEHGQPQ